jgi:hypothetical protein
MITALGFVADAWVIVAYAYLVRTMRVRPFHWANAVGCLPILGTEIVVRAWAPLILTVFFGALGWYGLIKGRR